MRFHFLKYKLLFNCCIFSGDRTW